MGNGYYHFPHIDERMFYAIFSSILHSLCLAGKNNGRRRGCPNEHQKADQIGTNPCAIYFPSLTSIFL
jgi:hypothetical protein